MDYFGNYINPLRVPHSVTLAFGHWDARASAYDFKGLLCSRYAIRVAFATKTTAPLGMVFYAVSAVRYDGFPMVL